MTTFDDDTIVVDVQSVTDVKADDTKLDDLLMAETYQGMSDRDINRIIEYKSRLAYEQGRVSETITALREYQAEQRERYAQAAQVAEAAFNAAIESSVRFQSTNEFGEVVTNEQTAQA